MTWWQGMAWIYAAMMLSFLFGYFIGHAFGSRRGGKEGDA